jgi:transcription elongation GreA/GreB family factor
MPRYYFHVRRGQVTVLDQEGREFADLVEAAKEAARRALQIEAIGTLKDVENNGAIIVDDEFSTVLEVPFGGSLVTFQSELRQAPRGP